MTVAQIKLRDKLLANSTLKRQEMISKNLFIAVEVKENSLFTAKQAMGIIGPRGRVDFDVYGFLSKRKLNNFDLLLRSLE